MYFRNALISTWIHQSKTSVSTRALRNDRCPPHGAHLLFSLTTTAISTTVARKHCCLLSLLREREMCIGKKGTIQRDLHFLERSKAVNDSIDSSFESIQSNGFVAFAMVRPSLVNQSIINQPTVASRPLSPQN